MGALSPCHPPPRTWHTLLPHSAPSYHPPNLICLPVVGTLTSQKPRLWSPDPGAAGGGKGVAGQGSFTAVTLRALELGGGAPGFSLGPRGGGCWSIPQAQTRVGVRAPGGLWAGLGSAQTSPQVLGCDPAQRGAAGAPALCAPAPAAQLLRMTSSHLPPPAPHLPAGWRRGGVLGVWGLRQEVPGAAGRCSPRTA